MLNIILLIIIGLCFLGLAFIIIRKIPQIKILDLETMPQERSVRVKDRILLERMRRSSLKSAEIIKKNTFPLFSNLLDFIKRLVNKIYILEKKYQRQAAKVVNLKGQELINSISKNLDDAQNLLKQEKYAEAEKLFIEIISLDPQSKAAYKGLVEIYRLTKEYKQALQTAQYILHLAKKRAQPVEKKDIAGQTHQTYSNANEIADAYVDFAELYKEMDRREEALQNYKKALELEPNNPRNLDEALSMAIAVGDKIYAFDLFKRLQEANPENQKIKDYQKKISEL